MKSNSLRHDGPQESLGKQTIDLGTYISKAPTPNQYLELVQDRWSNLQFPI
jgi:hypothetical protein